MKQLTLTGQWFGRQDEGLSYVIVPTRLIIPTCVLIFAKGNSKPVVIWPKRHQDRILTGETWGETSFHIKVRDYKALKVERKVSKKEIERKLKHHSTYEQVFIDHLQLKLL